MQQESPPAQWADLKQLDAAAMPGQATSATPEGHVLWSASEGQVVNAGVFLVALLFCWLVVPVAWALYRYLATANHRYVLTDQRLLVESGIIVKGIESVELYRVKDLAISSTLLQTIVGRGQITIQSTDTTCPTLLINAVPNAADVAQLIRNQVEVCRSAKGVRAFDF